MSCTSLKRIVLVAVAIADPTATITNSKIREVSAFKFKNTNVPIVNQCEIKQKMKSNTESLLTRAFFALGRFLVKGLKPKGKDRNARTEKINEDQIINQPKPNGEDRKMARSEEVNKVILLPEEKFVNGDDKKEDNFLDDIDQSNGLPTDEELERRITASNLSLNLKARYSIQNDWVLIYIDNNGKCVFMRDFETGRRPSVVSMTPEEVRSMVSENTSL